MPLPVTEDTPPDMLSGAMDIKVLLPNGRTINMSVERSTPMMDLLVQLTTAHKLSLAAHMTVALSESGAHLHHLPSTPIGALDTRLLHVMTRNNASLKRPALRPNNAQPFQTTFRLQVHLPRNQLFVSRVSPDTCLEDILNLACAEKNLDPTKYELRHPANLQEKLSLSHTLGDYRLQEVTMVASRAIGAPMTPADIMALQKEEEKRRQQVKATGSAYGIAFNKRSRTNVHQSTGSVSSDSLNGRSISPAPSDESAGRSISPPAPLPPTRPARKRRPAPKPPAAGELIQPPANSRTQEVLREDSMTSHSRTSSDSSGYHEASVLSESMDTRTNGGSPADTLPRRSKLPSSNHMTSKQHKSSTLQHGTTNHAHLSRSLSNLTSAAGISSMHSASTTSLASQGHLPRKKKAAPPPPVAPARRAVQVERKVNAGNEINNGLHVSIVIPITTKTIVEEDLPIPDNSVASPKHSASREESTAPKLVQNISTASLKRDSQSSIASSKSDVGPPRQNDESPKENIIPLSKDIVHHKKNTAPPKDDITPDVLKTVVQEPAIVPLPKPVPVDATCVIPVPTPQSSVTEDSAISDESVTSDLDSVLKDNHLDERNTTPELESSDWEYHLPAPPSAFRDLSSPTTTEFGTVMLADTQVFQETVEPQSLTIVNVATGKSEKRQEEVQLERVRNDSTGKIIEIDSKNDDIRYDDMSHKVGKSSPVTADNNYDKQSDVKVTIVVERRSDTKKRFTDEGDKSWEPQQLGVEERASTQGIKLINGDVRLRPGGMTKEVFKVNPLFDAQQFEEPNLGKSTTISGKYAPDEREIIEKSKTLITRSSSTDLLTSNTLKNFTISAYEKPKYVDTIFREDSIENAAPVFKKPSTPIAKPLPVVRTNSYTSNDISRPNIVKRSTSYISLARPYAKPSAFQSINRTKSISNLMLEEDSVCNELRKSTSDANLSRVTLDAEPPLHSLQVLKSILPQLSRSQTALNEERGLDEPIAMEEITTSVQPQAVDSNVNNTTEELAHPPTDMSNTGHRIVSTSIEKRESFQPSKEVNATNPDPKPFVYLGPPAINFGSWSERPKVQVSLKSDKDYRIGRQTSESNMKPATQASSIRINSFQNIAVEKLSTSTPNNNVNTKPTKIEPTPLTMRIVSHTHGGPRRSDISHNQNNSSLLENNDQKQGLQHGLNGFTSDNTSRLPIVRAVELKKTAPEHLVQLRNTSSTHLNGGINTSNVSKISVNNYQASNNVNRHSYIDGDSGHQALVNLGLTKSISTSQLNVDALNQSNKFSKKYTSVVGINGSGFVPAPAQLSTKPAVNARPSFNTIKVGTFSAPKPMPTVKGFRSTVEESANNATREEQTIKQDTSISSDTNVSNTFKSHPLKTLNGIDHMRTTPNWVQRSSAIVNDKVVNPVSESTNQPTTIKFKKPVQRPLEKKFTNPRDALMDAIKNFGGEDALKSKNKAID